MVEQAHKAGVMRIVLNGSFVTDIMEPNDVDCVLLAANDLKDAAAEEELLRDCLSSKSPWWGTRISTSLST
jgi:hypothetical protein